MISCMTVSSGPNMEGAGFASARLALRVAVCMYLGDGGLCPEKWLGRDQCTEFEHWRDRPGAIAPRRSGRSRRVLHGE
jgi:hypothetical protein